MDDLYQPVVQAGVGPVRPFRKDAADQKVDGFCQCQGQQDHGQGLNVSLFAEGLQVGSVLGDELVH